MGSLLPKLSSANQSCTSEIHNEVIKAALKTSRLPAARRFFLKKKRKYAQQ